MDRPGGRQVPEGSGEHGKMEKTGCKTISGAPTTLTVKGLIMMMIMMMMNQADWVLTGLLLSWHCWITGPLVIFIRVYEAIFDVDIILCVSSLNVSILIWLFRQPHRDTSGNRAGMTTDTGVKNQILTRSRFHSPSSSPPLCIEVCLESVGRAKLTMLWLVSV